jgi:hypothetical protein
MTRDEELTQLWREGGWSRMMDGKLYSLNTGEPCAGELAVPETSLPPLPDGTRPNQTTQIVGIDAEPLKTHTAPTWILLRRGRTKSSTLPIDEITTAPSEAEFATL